MKITIDTDIDTFDSAIRTVYVAYGFDVDDAESSPGVGSGELLDSGGWTEPLLRKWARMLADDAQEVIRYMATHAPEVSVADIVVHLGLSKGLDGPCGKHVLGGVMCSAGANRKKLRVTKLPFEYDPRRRRYFIDLQIAGILADELGDGGRSR